MDRSPEVERALGGLAHGGARAAERLFPIVYNELRDLAERSLRRERSGHTLQATALVHEVYLKIAGQDRAAWSGRAHFLAVAADAMRRILIDHARGRSREKRGGAEPRGRATLSGLDVAAESSDVDVIALADALERLDALDPDQAKVVRLRFFGGLPIPEISAVTGRAQRSVERDWTHARAWLARELA